MTDKPTKWGIISAGKISGDFCIALRTLPRSEHRLLAVAARKLEDAEPFAKKHGIEKAYGSYEELAADSDVDVIYIGSINSMHCELSIMMLRAGKHVLCEKPLGISTEEVKRMTEFAREKQLFFAEGFWSRFFPVYDQLRKELSSMSIGDVRLVSINFGFPLNWDLERISKKELGGGMTLDIGCYPVQMAALIFPKEKPEKITAVANLHSSGVDRSVSTTLFYKGGRMVQILISGECQLSNTALIYGTKGTLTLPGFWCPTEITTPKGTFPFPLPKPPEETYYNNSVGFVYEISGVRKALLEGKTQADQIDHEDSLLIAEIQEEILRQIWVEFH